jgi:hypothetical protein
LLIVPAVIALFVAVVLAIAGMRLRAVLRLSPWEAATVAGVRAVHRRNGRRPYTESDIVGADPRLPMTIRHLVASEGKPVWVALGPKSYVTCRPGAFGLRYGRLA